MQTLDYVNPVRNLFRIFSRDRSPRQIALGIALGVMIGLVPKGNLVAVLFTTLLFALRTNLGFGLTAAFLLTWAGPSVDQFSHQLGLRALKTPWIYQGLERGFQWPIVPWTSLNNTIVLGSTLLGCALFYPTYRVAERTATALAPIYRRIRHGKMPAPVETVVANDNANLDAGAGGNVGGSAVPPSADTPNGAQNDGLAPPAEAEPLAAPTEPTPWRISWTKPASPPTAEPLPDSAPAATPAWEPPSDAAQFAPRRFMSPAGEVQIETPIVGGEADRSRGFNRPLPDPEPTLRVDPALPLEPTAGDAPPGPRASWLREFALRHQAAGTPPTARAERASSSADEETRS